MGEVKEHPHDIRGLEKLNCFSRFLYSISALAIEKIYDAASPLVSKGSKERYDNILENILNKDKYDNINHCDAIVSSKAIRMFILMLDGIISIASIALIGAGIAFYFKLGI